MSVTVTATNRQGRDTYVTSRLPIDQLTAHLERAGWSNVRVSTERKAS